MQTETAQVYFHLPGWQTSAGVRTRSGGRGVGSRQAHKLLVGVDMVAASMRGRLAAARTKPYVLCCDFSPGMGVSTFELCLL